MRAFNRALYKKMPLTMAAFTLGGTIDDRPAADLWVLQQVVPRPGWHPEPDNGSYVLALIFSSLVNAVIFFRICRAGVTFGELEGRAGGRRATKTIDSHPPATVWGACAVDSMLVPLLGGGDQPCWPSAFLTIAPLSTGSRRRSTAWVPTCKDAMDDDLQHPPAARVHGFAARGARRSYCCATKPNARESGDAGRRRRSSAAFVLAMVPAGALTGRYAAL